MGRYLGPICRKSRSVGDDLEPKSGIRSRDSKYKANPPGQFGKNRARPSDYGLQLLEKQKLRYRYGLREGQFKRYYLEAARRKGSTGEILLQLLEQRLDNVVYRMGFGCTRKEARQLVSHRAILVNGKNVNIPSYRVMAGDVVEIKEKCRDQHRIKASQEINSQRPTVSWIDIDAKNFRGVFKSVPEASDLTGQIVVQLVVELYSK